MSYEGDNKVKREQLKDNYQPVIFYGTKCWASMREHRHDVNHKDVNAKMDLWQDL